METNDLLDKKPVKTHAVAPNVTAKSLPSSKKAHYVNRESLSTKKAVELLLGGTLKTTVCRYCLFMVKPLSELDQILHIGGRDALYKVTIREIVASFHPFKVVDDPNFPNKICEKCLSKAIQSYLFAQQCEQAERALRNCFDDIFEKYEKLDPLDRTNKRGRQKRNPNHNVLHAEHRKVIDYAEPVINLINSGSIAFTIGSEISDLECKRCWQVLPDLESLLNHEKIHPKTMWYHCRLCGKSFPKRYQIKQHIRNGHGKNKELCLEKKTEFECKQCSFTSDNVMVHLQHIEKHKFQDVLQHLVERKMDKLCAVCLDKGKEMVDLDKIICLHGGYPELTGDRSLYNILGSSVPEMNTMQNYTGSQICVKCIDYAIISYLFINKTHYIRNRLDVCVTQMLNSLNQITTPESKIFIEIAQNSILPVTGQEFDESLLLDYCNDLDDANDVNETKLKVDVLEDEFRIKSDSEESYTESEHLHNVKAIKTHAKQTKDKINIISKDRKANNNMKRMNGYQLLSTNNEIHNVCSEFLTFKRKKKHIKRNKCKFTCPLCNKHFISEYFLRRHVLKHVNRKVECKICWMPLKSKFHLHEHMKIHKSNESYSFCKTCGRVFGDKNRLKLHQKCHEVKECHLCLKIFISQKFHDSHMQRHAVKQNMLKPKRVQICSFCEKQCSNDVELSTHVNKVHLQIKPHACDMCERQFYTDTVLKNHKKIHSLFSKEKCEFCKKTLLCRKDLVVHVRKHLDIKPFICVVCSQAFHSESKLNNHMSNWHGGRFCCRLCKKVFVNQSGLKNHVTRAHSVF